MHLKQDLLLVYLPSIQPQANTISFQKFHFRSTEDLWPRSFVTVRYDEIKKYNLKNVNPFKWKKVEFSDLNK